MRLEFTKPMKATNRALFMLAPVGDGTRITWRMEGTNNFVGKAASLVMNMDEMVGGHVRARPRGPEDAGRGGCECSAPSRRPPRRPRKAVAPTMTFKETESEIEAAHDDPATPATPPADE